MASSIVIRIIAACLVLVVCQLHDSSAAGYSKRDHYSKRATAAQEGAEESEAKWKPNLTPSHFNFKVKDNIKGADQMREESVKDGEVTGFWAVPADKGMWLRTDYRAGKDGFHIVSEKLIPQEDMTGLQKTNPDEANIEIDQLGGNTAYTVKGSDINKVKSQQPIKRSLGTAVPFF